MSASVVDVTLEGVNDGFMARIVLPRADADKMPVGSLVHVTLDTLFAMPRAGG